MKNMGMFWKPSPNLVFDILFLWLFGSLVGFISIIVLETRSLKCTSCGCRIYLPSGRSCSSLHSLSLACHPLGRPRRSSHPVDLLAIHPCGRCKRSYHPSGKTCSSSQPLALTATSRLLSLVPWAGLTNPPSPPTCYIFPLFSLPFLGMNLSYVRLNELLLSHIFSHLSHLNFPHLLYCPLFLPPHHPLVFPVP